MNILVIDDKDDARYFLEVLLKGKGHHVFSATNGKEALEVLKADNIELIISDILMPDMDGFEFCKIIKNDDTLKRIPFIFYTATYVDKKDEEFALSLGADMFLRKPMAPDTLMDEINSLIKKIEENTYTPQDIKLKTETEIYKLYNRRLIKKLEDKIEQLEMEVDKRTKTEMKLRKTVQEKEILIKELYHRTRNNMQVIISMLKLYSAKLIDEKWNEKVIEDITNKIRTMALVHSKLYESQDLSHVNLKDYFESLIELLKESYYTELEKCSVVTDFEDVSVLLDTAIPLGFILNELITNACQHAFPEHKEGTISLKLFRNENKQMELIVQDDGIGLPEDFQLDADDNIGLLIISGLVKQQLQGFIQHISEKGLKWTIKIDKENYSERI